MKNISSKDNLIVKKFKKLSQKKYRKEYGSFLVENFVIVRDAYKAGFQIKNILVTDNFIDKNQAVWDEIVDKVDVNNIYVVDDKINKIISSLETPSGIVVEYDIPSRELDNSRPIVYLNSINDPGNLGTIFRNCLAFGFENVVCDDKCVDIYNPKTISAAKDSILKINIKIDNNFSFFENNPSLPVYVSNVEEGSSLREFSFPDRYILVFGSESHGVDEYIKGISKASLNINISKNIESLNVSSAVAVFLYVISNK